MQLIIGAYAAFWPTLAVFLFCLLMMYVLWYRNLPPAGSEDEPREPFDIQKIRWLEREPSQAAFPVVGTVGTGPRR
jgi:hypothetical protein